MAASARESAWVLIRKREDSQVQLGRVPDGNTNERRLLKVQTSKLGRGQDKEHSRSRDNRESPERDPAGGGALGRGGGEHERPWSGEGERPDGTQASHGRLGVSR